MESPCSALWQTPSHPYSDQTGKVAKTLIIFRNPQVRCQHHGAETDGRNWDHRSWFLGRGRDTRRRKGLSQVTSVLGLGALSCLPAMGHWERPDSFTYKRPVLPGELPSAHIYCTLEQPCLGQLQTWTQPQWVRKNPIIYSQLLHCTHRNDKGQVEEMPSLRLDNKGLETRAPAHTSEGFCVWHIIETIGGAIQSAFVVVVDDVHHSITGFDLDTSLCRVH